MNLENSESPCIIFAHLGSINPKHLWPNIQRTHSLFPTAEIHFIKDSNLRIPSKVRSIVTIHEYLRTPEIAKIRSAHLHDSSFRQGFWWLSLERIIAVGQAHLATGRQHAIHLESDVMLMPNFPWGSLSDSQIHWCRYNEARDVAAIVSLPSQAHTEWLMKEIIQRIGLDSTHTDMTLLSEISQVNDQMVQILPSLGTTEMDLRNLNNSSKLLESLSLDNSYVSKGIFDGAAIGMWLCGQDPRNHYGVTRYRSQNIIESGDSFVDPSRFGFSYNSQDGLRMLKENSYLEIWNLHIHSKNQRLLGLDWEAELQRILGMKNKCREFDLKILLSLILSNLRQGTFLRFCLSFPPIYSRLKPLMDRLWKSK